MVSDYSKSKSRFANKPKNRQPPAFPPSPFQEAERGKFFSAFRLQNPPPISHIRKSGNPRSQVEALKGLMELKGLEGLMRSWGPRKTQGADGLRSSVHKAGAARTALLGKHSAKWDLGAAIRLFGSVIILFGPRDA